MIENEFYAKIFPYSLFFWFFRFVSSIHFNMASKAREKERESTVDGKTVGCSSLSLVRTSHSQVQIQTYTHLADDVHKFMATIKFHWLYIYNTYWIEIHRPMHRILCTTDTVAYLFLDWNVKSDVYSLKQSIRTANTLGYIVIIIVFVPIFFLFLWMAFARFLFLSTFFCLV